MRSARIVSTWQRPLTPISATRLMTAKGAIQEALEREVRKLIQRHNRAASGSVHNRRRYEKRSGETGRSSGSNIPPHRAAHPQFNPYYVRSRLESFSHAIARKVRLSKYTPNPTLLVPIPKPGGGYREIAISTVPDAAVSYWLGRRLIERNSYRFSNRIWPF